jgi:hypothetical protein
MVLLTYAQVYIHACIWYECMAISRIATSAFWTWFSKHLIYVCFFFTPCLCYIINYIYIINKQPYMHILGLDRSKRLSNVYFPMARMRSAFSPSWVGVHPSVRYSLIFFDFSDIDQVFLLGVKWPIQNQRPFSDPLRSIPMKLLGTSTWTWTIRFEKVN